jgi:hypothetical protein
MLGAVMQQGWNGLELGKALDEQIGSHLDPRRCLSE